MIESHCRLLAHFRGRPATEPGDVCGMRIVSFISLVLLLIGGCHEVAPPADVEVQVLGDRSDANHEWVFAFRGNEIVAQRHIFPGYDQPIIFSYSGATSVIPCDFLIGPGNVEPPFVPHGPLFYRVDVPTDESAETRTVYFSDDTLELRRALSDLAALIQSQGKRLDELPDWITESTELRSYFGPADAR